ncbi:PBP1A family penicillin-binding protein, partial [Patescibacteria group bacterium]|nr:PBP1A family penicillin-binding protein [Patescibacteria group bacterium]
IDAVLASEDLNFYHHGAIDPKGLLRATYLNYNNSEKEGLSKFKDLFDEKNYSQGGSSITQQLVKNLYLSNERSFDRKVKEIVYAFELEKKYTKDEILEMYLNNVYFGEQSLGIKNAARTYYGKDLDKLSLAEITMLVGLPVAPTRLSPISGDFEAAKERQRYVLSQMYYAGMITLEEANVSSAENLFLNYSGVDSFIKYPYFVNYVREQVKERVGEDAYNRGGLTVETTLDPKIQEIAEFESKKQIESLKFRNVTNAAVVIINNETGDLEAMVGGVDYETSKVNVATAERQPGSSFKPIVYTAGLIKGYTSSSLLWDGYVNFGGIPPYIPKNYDGYYRGNVTVRTALQNSLNVPAVEMTKLVGVEEILKTAKTLGLKSINENRDHGLSIGLGSAEVRLLDLARAYSTLSSQGQRPNATVINKILDSNDTEIYIQPKLKEKVLDEKIAFIMTNILSDNVSRRQVFGVSSNLQLGNRPVAAKTGTTDSFADNWTMGYTPQYTVGVWVGNNDRSVMRNVSGLDGAAPIWNIVMKRIHTNLEILDFDKPDGLTELWISPYTGRPATYKSRPNILEYYIPDTEPKKDEKFDYLNQFKFRR